MKSDIDCIFRLQLNSVWIYMLIHIGERKKKKVEEKRCCCEKLHIKLFRHNFFSIKKLQVSPLIDKNQ